MVGAILPQVALRNAVPLSYARAMATDHIVLDNYYDLLEHVLQSKDILDKPGNIFNCDESGIQMSKNC